MRRAAASGVAGVAAGALAAIAADVGAIAIVGVLVLVMVGLLFRAQHWMRLAGRSRIGARSEDDVRQWRRGCTAGGGAGVAAERSPSNASCAPEALSGSVTGS